MNAPAFEGGRSLVVRAAAVGVAGLALTAVGVALDPRRALFAYLTAYVYWLGIALAAMVFLMANETAGARWFVVVRRLLESLPATVLVLAVLFLPVALGMRQLFPWVDPAAATHAPLQPWAHGEQKLAIHLWEHRHPWMNVPFFLVRAGLYFVIWIAVATLLRGWSLKQDQSGDPALTLKMRRLSAGGLPFVALAITFAAFDWQMSLSAFLFSTIFGVYWFAGSFVSAVAVLILAVAAASRFEPLKSALNPEPRARARKVPARLHRLLGLHRLLPVPAHLDRQPPRGGALVPGAVRHRVEVGGDLPRAGPVRGALRVPALPRPQAAHAPAGLLVGVDPGGALRGRLLGGDAPGLAARAAAQLDGPQRPPGGGRGDAGLRGVAPAGPRAAAGP
jgi:hypothetical protein